MESARTFSATLCHRRTFDGTRTGLSHGPPDVVVDRREKAGGLRALCNRRIQGFMMLRQPGFDKQVIEYR